MDAAFGVWLEHIFYHGQNQLKKQVKQQWCSNNPYIKMLWRIFFFNSSNDWLSEYLPNICYFSHLRPVALALSHFVDLCKDTMTSGSNDFIEPNFISQ